MASSTTPDSDETPRLSEEAIPVPSDQGKGTTSKPQKSPIQNQHQNGETGQSLNISKSVQNHGTSVIAQSASGNSPTGRSKTFSGISTSPTTAKSRGKVRPEDETRSQKNWTGSKTSQSGRSHSPKGKHVNPSNSDAMDLTDPAKLMKQLVNVNLTEEDTDLLLEEAYALNKKLRAELQRQEESAKRGSPHRLPPLLDGGHQVKMQEKSRVYGAPMPAASRPIQSRSKTTQSAAPMSQSQPGHHGVMSERRAQQRSPSRRSNVSQSAAVSRNKEKPAWDDRFSFG